MASFLAAASATAALPTVTDVTLSQNDDTRLVTINYTLTGDTPAIVTADICTNGASVGRHQQADRSDGGCLHGLLAAAR